MKRVVTALAPALLLAACGEAQVARPASVAAKPAPYVPVPGTAAAAAPAGSVRGQDARALIARFGEPRIDMTEGKGRKLQFLGSACVLDTYLYVPARGKEAVVTHVDARRRDGVPVDEAGCVAALTRAGS